MNNRHHQIRAPANSARLPLFAWKKTTAKEEIEISVGPSVAWLIFALVALAVKGLNAINVIQSLLTAWQW